MSTLYLDLETFCEVPISHGTHAYAEQAEVLLVAWALDDGPVQVHDCTTGAPWPLPLANALSGDAGRVVIHNSAFDRTVLSHATDVLLEPEQVDDTMVQALAHGLPGALGTLCDVLRIDTDKAKDKEGRQLVHLFCKPRPKNSKLRRATRDTHPAEWARFIEYARLDVAAMREVYRKLPRWNLTDAERALWCLDQRVNDRGVAIDLPLAEGAVRAVALEQEHLAERAQALTDGAVAVATQRDALLQHLLLEFGIDLPDLQKATVERMLANPDLPDALRELLAVRLQATTTSTAKYKTLRRATSHDGRLRGTLQFCGAGRTGRWAGRLFQPQNLPRASLPQAEIDAGVAALKVDAADLLTDNVMELCSSAVRSALIAPPGRKLVAADLANIEGRMLAWLAGENWKLRAFTAFDQGAGPDLYKAAYAKAFGVSPDAVAKDQRQIGKVMELMLGYEGGVGAFLTGAATYGIDLEAMADAALPSISPAVQEEARSFLAWRREQKLGDFGLTERAFIACDSIKRLWREAHPATVTLWRALESACIDAVLAPGRTLDVGKLRVRRDGSWLRIGLPSGRCLCYPGAAAGEDGKLSYLGVNQYSRKWGRIKTYGGKLCLASGTLVLTRAGWIPIESVDADTQVWDGCEWVRTAGRVFKGIKPVIQAYGAWMTPDHEVLTDQGWRNASQSQRYNRAACRLPDGCPLPGQRWEEVPVARPLRLWRLGNAAGHGAFETGQPGDHGVLRVPAEGHDQPQAHDAWHEPSPGIRRVAVNGRPLPATDAPRLAQLWGKGHQSVRRMGAILRGFLGRHGGNVSAGLNARSDRQRPGIRAGQLPMDDLQGAGQQPPRYETVYDLIDCGPRHCFAVWAGGAPLIVHNCENVTQAAARDVLAASMPAIEAAGYQIVLTVHDEVITEAPDSPEFSATHLADLMATNPPWAPGLPLAAAGFEAPAYRKE